MVNKGLIIGVLVCLAVIMLPLGIASTVLGFQKPGSCDYKDAMGLDVGQYLVGLGISSIALTIAMIVLMAIALTKESVVAGVILAIVHVLGSLFGLAWFIVGAIILFRGNIECINNASVHVIYALVLWCFSACGVIYSCTRVGDIKNIGKLGDDA